MRKIVYSMFVAGAVVLASCGGDKPAEGTAATTDSSATATTAEATPATTEETPAAEGTAPAETSTPAASGSTSSSGSSTTKSEPKGKTEAAPTKNIIGTALDAGRFTELANAVSATGLASTLANPGPFTFFAPNDEAFAKIDPTAKANLMKPESKNKLINILKLHVTNGNNTIESLVGPAFATFNGKSLTVKKEGNGYKVGKANVVKANIKATNGIIHEIDAVLIPADY